MSAAPKILSACSGCSADVFVPSPGDRPVPMAHDPGCAIADLEPCDWCGGPIESDNPAAETCQGRCKAARWKWREGYGRPAALRAANRGTNRKRKGGGPRGVALPYRRTTDEVAAALIDGTAQRRVDQGEDPYLVAREIVTPAASAKDRERLSRRAESEYPEEAGR
jgi:hypothetical protein